MKNLHSYPFLLIAILFLAISTAHSKNLTDLKPNRLESVGAGPNGPGGETYYSLRAYDYGAHDLIHDLPPSERSTDTQTLTAYFKDTGSRWVYLGTRASGKLSRSYFDLVNGTAGASPPHHQPEITARGEGWYQLKIRYPGTHVTSVHFGIAQGNGAPHFTGSPGTDRVYFSEPALQTRSMAGDNTKALWVWTADPVLNVSARTELLTFVLNHELNRVYIDARVPVLHNQYMLAEFIKTFHSRGVAVELMFGKPEWALYMHHHELLDLVDQSVEFVHRYPDARPDGVHLDIEAHLVRQWHDNRNSVANQLLDLFQKVSNRIGSVSLPLVVDMPVWWDQFSVPREGYSRPLHHWVIDAAQGVALMDYRDTEYRIVNDADAELRYASSRGKHIIVGVESMCIEPASITFCEEGADHMEFTLRRVNGRLRSAHSSYRGFAVHHYHAYQQLRR